MNIDYINAIPLRKIFDKLKLRLIQESNSHSLYSSPFRKEELHTIEVNQDTNTWFDNSILKSGGPLEFITDWLQSQEQRCSLPDVINWFRFNIGYPCMQDGISPVSKAPKVKLVYKSPILDRALINYIESKDIHLPEAQKHLCQLGLTNLENGEDFAALGLKIDEGGWWIHNPYISTFKGSKSISYIRGTHNKFRAVHVFQNIFDYLLAVKSINNGQPFNDESIILNSFECLENSAAYIRGFGYRTLYTWFDNTIDGKQATKNYTSLSRIEDGLQHMLLNSE